MKSWKKILITCTCLFLILIIGGIMYANYFINNIVLAQIPQQVIDTNLNSNMNITNNNKESNYNIINSNTTENTANPTGTNKNDVQTDISKLPYDETTVKNNNPQPINPSTNNTDSNKKPSDSPITESNNITPTPNTEIANTVQQEIGKPIETTDLLQAGFIILRKLGKDEISFLFGFSDKSYTSEELVEVRRLLLSKLNDGEIKTLRVLGQKYGKKLEILDPTVPIN